MAISNGGQCPQLNSGLGTSHGWLSSMWIERSDTLIHALGYNTTLFAGQSEGWYVLILVPKKLEDFETFNVVLQRGARRSSTPPRRSTRRRSRGLATRSGWCTSLRRRGQAGPGEHVDASSSGLTHATA